ncbi:MAG TPA: hypothetical protein VIQ74_10900 [Gemmatimonadaceae bacterium]
MRVLLSTLMMLGLANTATVQAAGRYASVNGLKMYSERHCHAPRCR